MAEEGTIFDGIGDNADTNIDNQQIDNQQIDNQQGDNQNEQQSTGNEWLPEEFRADKSFAKFKDINGLAKSYKEMQSMLGKKGSAIPTAESSAEEWGNFYKQMGVPETAEEYKFETDEALKLPESLCDNDMQKLYKDIFKEANLTPQQAQSLWNARNKYFADEIASQQAEYNKNVENVTNQLKKDWGDNFNAELNKAFQSFRYLYPDTDPKDFPLVNNLDFVRTLNKMHSLIGDDKIIQTKNPGNSLASVESEITQILNNPDYHNPMSLNHNSLMERMLELQGQKIKLKGR